VGLFDGIRLVVGSLVGFVLGSVVGLIEGVVEGVVLGQVVGAIDGIMEGLTLGVKVGPTDGAVLGALLGATVGVSVGIAVGDIDGGSLGESECEGLALGVFDGNMLGAALGEELNILNSSGKSTLPQPVRGSQPLVAWKPLGQQLSLLPPQHVLVPEVISLNFPPLDIPNAYSVGFKKPTEGRPILSRSELTREIIAANTGDDAEVPKRFARLPCSMT
jgi:hypothetical protein